MARTRAARDEGSARERLELLDVIDRLRRAEGNLASGDTERATAEIAAARTIAQGLADGLLAAADEMATGSPATDDTAIEIVRAAQEGPGYESTEGLTDGGASIEERFMGADGRVVTFVRVREAPPAGDPPTETSYGIVSTVDAGRIVREERFGSWRDALAAVGGAARRQARG